MPLYEVYHSYPFTDQQRQALATSITNLHCTTFTTPSFFVHVRFIKHDASDRTYYMAGKPSITNSNRIIGIVRTSPARSRSAFDALATKIEDAWYNALKGTVPGGLDEVKRDSNAKRLLMVTFTPIVSIREGGMTIPEAGEGSWLKEQLLFIKEMSKSKDLEDFTKMLKELEEREDLKKLLE